MIEKKIDHMQAYKAMFFFLEQYYNRTNSDDIGSLLSGMSLMNDNQPIDMAYMQEWEEAINKAIEDTIDIKAKFVLKN